MIQASERTSKFEYEQAEMNELGQESRKFCEAMLEKYPSLDQEDAMTVVRMPEATLHIRAIKRTRMGLNP